MLRVGSGGGPSREQGAPQPLLETPAVGDHYLHSPSFVERLDFPRHSITERGKKGNAWTDC